MQGESRAVLGPFAKASRTVSRYRPEVDASSCGPSAGDFVDRLAQQTSSCWMEEYHEAPMLLTSGCVSQPLPSQEISILEKLPSPRELGAKKKRGLKRKRLENVSALSVLYHLEDLKRRQKDMDEQKAAPWGSCSPELFPRANPEGAVGDSSANQELLSPCRTPQPTQPYWKDVLFGPGADIQLLRPAWNPDLRAQLRTPEGRAGGVSRALAGAANRPPPGRARGWPEEGREWEWEGLKLQHEE